MQKAQRLLRDLGHEVTWARNADDGVREIIDWRPDLVLANGNTAEGDEEAFTARAFEVDPALPVVLLFSKETQENVALFNSANALNYLIRPLKESEITAAVRAALAVRDLRLELRLVVEERDALARDVAGSQQEQDARERFYQFEFFKKVVAIELKRSRRYSFPLSFMLVAYDESDVISGSPYARELFSDLARIIRKGVRDIDIPISFSEESILVMMPHTELDGALVVADRIREQASLLPETYGVVEETTVSVGVVCTQTAPRLEFGDLMQRVTRALREAKRGGGDTVVDA